MLLSLFIYALAPASGGHINPIITFATMATGLTGFSRGILYVIAQVTGAAVAGGLIQGSFGRDLALLYIILHPYLLQSLTSNSYNGGGCYLVTTVISEGQAYLIESVLSFILLSVLPHQ